MKHFSRIYTGVLLAAISAAALASPSIVGKWKGKIVLDKVPVSASTTPQEKAQIKAVQDKFAKITLLVDIKKDGTFTESDPMSKSTQTGRWSQNGDKVTISPNGKGKGEPQTLTLDKSGKVMVLHVARITLTLRKV